MIVHKRNIAGYRFELDLEGTYRAYKDGEPILIREAMEDVECDFNDLCMFQAFVKEGQRKLRKIYRDKEKGKANDYV